MRILFISDVHLGYDFETNTLLVNKIVNKTNPDLILSAGDWDLDVEIIQNGLTPEKFTSMFNNKPIYSIIGNHDNESGEALDFILSLENPDGSKIFFEDQINVNNLTLLGKSTYFNANNTGDFMKWVVQHRNTNPDFLILHDCPNQDVNLIDWVIKTIKPRIILCGHVHDKSFYHEERTVFIKSTDPLCSNKYEPFTTHLFKVITFPPFTGYAVIEYNPDSKELLGFTLSRFR